MDLRSGSADESTDTGTIKTFGLPPKDEMQLNDHNALFSPFGEQDYPVTVRIWLEGSDARLVPMKSKETLFHLPALRRLGSKQQPHFSSPKLPKPQQ